jgi:hypothetical protein
LRIAIAARRDPRPAVGDLVGVHVSGGRAIKQWPPERFAEVAAQLADVAGRSSYYGSASDRALVSI